jgi:hypothetical protein
MALGLRKAARCANTSIDLCSHGSPNRSGTRFFGATWANTNKIPAARRIWNAKNKKVSSKILMLNAVVPHKKTWPVMNFGAYKFEIRKYEMSQESPDF